MIRKFKTLWADEEFFKPTSIIFSSSIIVHLFNFLYWFIMVRILSHENFGILNSLVSLFVIISLPVTVFQTVVTKFIAEFESKKNYSQIKSFFCFFFKKISIASTILFLLFIVFRNSIANYLNIPYTSVIIILGIMLFLSFFHPFLIGMLQGLHKFLSIAINSISNVSSKIIIGVILVLLGFKVNGALLGFVISYCVIIILALFQLPKYVYDSKAPILQLNIKRILKFFLPTAIAFFSFNSLINMDMVLIKHFFNVDEAGIYSISQFVGKIIFFLPSALTIVMLPKFTKLYSNNQNTKKLLLKNLFLTFILIIAAGSFIFIFPRFTLRIITNTNFPECVFLVKLFVISMSFFSFVYILMFYFLSLHKFVYVWFIAISCIMQFILINIFHSSMSQVLYIIVANSLVLCTSGLFLLRRIKND